MPKLRLPSGWRYYWAYGANLNKRGMSVRCPGAIKVQRLDVPNAALVFRGVADVEYRRKSFVPGGLWMISREHEAALDCFEGVARGVYDKHYLRIRLSDRAEHRVLFYRMRADFISVPSISYYATIAEGYEYFGLPRKMLRAALKEAMTHEDDNSKFAKDYANDTQHWYGRSR